ncbi:DUF2070 domain-containing protein [Halobacteriales archaeon QH_10_70_21]|nr:MAG: DUF2070 domain-containing protein [Halobacteriales archaeon QH_10_70_21]
MTQSQGDLAALSRFVFRTPDWSISLLAALLIAAVAGIGAFDSRFVLDAYNRSALLALVCEVVLVVFLVAGAAVAAVVGFWQDFVFDALVVGLASVFALRLFVIVAVSRQPFLVATVPASIQTGTAAALAFVYSGTVRYLEIGGPLVDTYLAQTTETPPELAVVSPGDFLVLGVLCGIYAVAVYGFVVAIDRPWRRSLGVSVLDFIRGFVGHIAEGSRELESFFGELGEEAVVPVTVLGVRRADGTEKARFVLPMIHPGPMGEIGGGNLPERVARSIDGLAFPPHATAGHDFNLVTEREVDTLLSAADRANDRIEYQDRATESVREQEGESKLLGQAFGDDALVVATHAPGCADDVDFSVGLSTAAEARVGGIGDVMLVDAHNCNDGLNGDDLGHVVPGSRRSFDMMTAAGRLGERLVEADRRPLRMGVAWDPTDWEPEEGIGPLGIRVAVVEVGEGETAQRTVYCLVDGNNMDPGVREELLAVIDADEAEVMTTDTHVVNTMEATNQVGGEIDVEDLADVAADLVDEAVADLEPVEAGMAVERTEVTVFGNDRTEALASTANVMIQMGGALLVLVIGGSMAVSLLILLLT